MQHAAGFGTSAQPDGRNDNHRAIVSDLVALIEHVQASIKLFEAAIVTEFPLGNQEIGGNVIVLDDVTPRYIRVNAALSACDANLGVALHVLRDASTLRQGPTIVPTPVAGGST